MRGMSEALLVALDDAVTDDPLAANPVTKVKRPGVPEKWACSRSMIATGLPDARHRGRGERARDRIQPVTTAVSGGAAASPPRSPDAAPDAGAGSLMAWSPGAPVLRRLRHASRHRLDQPGEGTADKALLGVVLQPADGYDPMMATVPPGHSAGLDADRILAQPLFSSLTRQEAEEFASFCEVRHVEPGRVVFSRGGLAVAFFVIESGEAEAVADGRLLRTIRPQETGSGRSPSSSSPTEPLPFWRRHRSR